VGGSEARFATCTRSEGAFVLGAFVYSPWASDAAIAAAVRGGVFPLLAVSGLLLWRGPALLRLVRGRRVPAGG